MQKHIESRKRWLLMLVIAGWVLTSSVSVAANHPTWRGLVVEDENRCSSYNRESDYRYSQSLEARIVERMGGQIYSPYCGTVFSSTSETDIEHIVSLSEAHDSGLCRADVSTRRHFASDLDNLTLAPPAKNRCNKGGKCGFDAGEWLPESNRCWFAARVVAVKQKYGLSVDQRERDALETVLSECDSLDME